MKAIITDLDRTLLHTDKSISEYTIKVMKECQSKGIKLIAATARPVRTVQQFDELIGFDALVVSNGARIIYNGTKEEFGFSDHDKKHVFGVLNSAPDLRITLETGDEAYSNKPIEDYPTTITNDLLNVSLKEGALKLIVSYDSEKALETVQKAMTDDLYYSVANGHLLQIMSKAAAKWNGVKSILRILDIDPAESVYFGDDNDDIEPIKNCGVGVAVSNAIDAVKEAADHITVSNNDDGVAKFIEEYFLYKK